MTGPEHYRKAEQLAGTADTVMDADFGIYASMDAQERIQRRAAYLAEAQAHATLALAAATALGLFDSMPVQDSVAWLAVVRDTGTEVTR